MYVRMRVCTFKKMKLRKNEGTEKFNYKRRKRTFRGDGVEMRTV
jgi:hypothetical protein